MQQTEKILNFFLITQKMEKQITRLKALYMKSCGLNGADLPLSLVLNQNREGCRQDEITQMIQADKAQVSRSLTRMMEAGLVEKENASIYKSRYFLSEAGIEAAADLERHGIQIFENMHTAIPDEQWTAFYGFLENINDAIAKLITEKMDEDPKTK